MAREAAFSAFIWVANQSCIRYGEAAAEKLEEMGYDVKGPVEAGALDGQVLYKADFALLIGPEDGRGTASRYLPELNTLADAGFLSPSELKDEILDGERASPWIACWAANRAWISPIRGTGDLGSMLEDELPTFQQEDGDLSDGGAESQSSQASVRRGHVSGQATAEDDLGFAPYVAALGGFLTSPDTAPPLTVSVEGPWGSGKTSFLLQLEEWLDCQPASDSKESDTGEGEKEGKERRYDGASKESVGSPVTVWFNPWRHEGHEALWAAFALTFIEGLRASVGWWERIKGDFRLFRRRLQWGPRWIDRARLVLGSVAAIAGVIGMFLLIAMKGEVVLDAVVGGQPATGVSLFLEGSIWALYGFAVLTGAKYGWNRFAHAWETDLQNFVTSPDYEGRVGFVQQFHEDFESIADAYVGDRRVFVFIDDLDRCSVPRAADLISALNLMISDDSRVIFLLAMDREKVAAGIAAKHDEILRFLDRESAPERGLQVGYHFVEKFVQVPFRLPEPKIENIEQMINRLSGDQARVGQATAGGAPGERKEGHPETRLYPRVWSRTETDEAGQSALRSERRRSPQPLGKLEIELATDSEKIRRLTLLVAPGLGRNPRRIKQFVNLFRLRAYISYMTGLFEPTTLGTGHRLKLEQLAKFVALSIRWPLLVKEIAGNPRLLTELQIRALESGVNEAPNSILGDHVPSANTEPPSDRVNHWAQVDDLRLLLQAGIIEDGELVEDALDRYSLATVDLSRLLRVSPEVSRPERGVEPDPRGDGEETEENPQGTGSETRRESGSGPDSEVPEGAEEFWDEHPDLANEIFEHGQNLRAQDELADLAQEREWRGDEGTN